MVISPRNTEDHAAVVKWLKQRIGPEFSPSDKSVSWAVVDVENASIKAGFLLDNITKYNATINLASDVEDKTFWSNDMVVSIFEKYIWGPPLELIRMTALVESTNKRSIITLQRLGFLKEGESKDLHGPGTVVEIYGLLKADYMEQWHGRQGWWREL